MHPNQELDFKQGGRFKMSFINFSAGNGHFFGGEYLEIKPNELIKYSDKFDDPGLPGEMTTTVRLQEVSCGTHDNLGRYSKCDTWRNVRYGLAGIS